MYLKRRLFISIKVQREVTVLTSTDHRSLPVSAIGCHFGCISKHSNLSAQQPTSCDILTNVRLFSGFSALMPGGVVVVTGCVRTCWSPVDVSNHFPKGSLAREVLCCYFSFLSSCWRWETVAHSR